MGDGIKKGFQNFGNDVKHVAQKAWGGIKKTGKAISKVGGKIVHGIAVAADYALQAAATVLNKIPIFGAPLVMTARAADIGVAGVAAVTKNGFKSFGGDTKAYFKDQLKHSGFATSMAGVAAEAIPGGNEVGTAAKIAMTAARIGTNATKVVGGTTQKTPGNQLAPESSATTPRSALAPQSPPPAQKHAAPQRAPVQKQAVPQSKATAQRGPAPHQRQAAV